jgi:RNA polymerase primary sigma factor
MCCPTLERAERAIYREYQAGANVDNLAQRFEREPADIARLVKKKRALQMQETPLSYVPYERFAEISADRALEAAVLGPAPADRAPRPATRPPSDAPAYVASLYEVPLLTAAQESHLFRKMNYLKFKANVLREKLDPRRPSAALMDRIEECEAEAVALRNQLVRANLRLVIAVAKRHVGPTDSFFELVSDGNMTLLRAVEKFDFARGNRFSTYAVEALENTFARNIPAEHRRQNRFRTANGDAMRVAVDDRPDAAIAEKADVRRQSDVARILQRLEPRDRQIIIRRFGLQRGCEPRKLWEISQELGVTKERVRQIEMRAIGRLRQVAIEEKIEIPT